MNPDEIYDLLFDFIVAVQNGDDLTEIRKRMNDLLRDHYTPAELERETKQALERIRRMVN